MSHPIHATTVKNIEKRKTMAYIVPEKKLLPRSLKYAINVNNAANKVTLMGIIIFIVFLSIFYKF